MSRPSSDGPGDHARGERVRALDREFVLHSWSTQWQIVGMATIGAIRDERIVERTAALGDVVARELAGLAARHVLIGDVRGLGLLWALELVRDRDSRQPLVPFNAKGAAAAPPLSITAEQLGDGMAILDDALGAADLAV